MSKPSKFRGYRITINERAQHQFRGWKRSVNRRAQHQFRGWKRSKKSVNHSSRSINHHTFIRIQPSSSRCHSLNASTNYKFQEDWMASQTKRWGVADSMQERFWANDHWKRSFSDLQIILQNTICQHNIHKEKKRVYFVWISRARVCWSMDITVL